MSFGRLIARLFVVPFGLAIAILSAGLFLWAALLAMDPAALGDSTVERILTGTIFAAFTIFATAHMMPLIVFVAILCAEIFRWRSLYLYLALGSLAGLLAISGLSEPVEQNIDLRLITTGLVGGLVYWLIAGRSAGIMHPDKPLG
ncbi:MAG: hypothetical protein JKY49_09710 [Cohaesibacteraceae bacterium]|nr:hypothetical protein [Cohaesibacteraceae bacterium]MBL4876233.1 hypothetical protein [Cohaesibacteraceae bacterium]